MATRRPAAAASDAPRTLNEQQVGGFPGAKALISGLVLLHVTAVFWAPFAFASNVGGGSSSPFADSVMAVFRPYIGAMYLNHGYFFFAPVPGPSHLVEYKLEFADGRDPITGRFPDLKTQQPRLLYHRYFMLAEALNNQYVPPTPPPEPSPPARSATADERARYLRQAEEYKQVLATWHHARQQYDALRQSFEKHLKDRHGAARVTLTRIEHQLPNPGQVRDEHRRLDAADSYVPLPETASPGDSR